MATQPKRTARACSSDGGSQLPLESTERPAQQPSGHQYGNLTTTASSRGHFGDNFHTGDIHHHYASSRSFQTVREECLKSLYFTDIKSRMSSIGKAHPKTFTWFWSRPDVDFQSWLESPRDIYWIRGNPGSGKSTLMKCVYQSPELSNNLCRISDSASCAVAFYAFDSKTSHLPGSIEGMLRSLLWQLMQDLAGTCEAIVEQYTRMKASQPEIIWASEDLLSALLRLLQDSSHAVICLMIDGLDEFHGEDEAIARFIVDLETSIPSNVRLCVASRPYPDFAFQFRQTKHFDLRDHTSDDISTYVRDRFTESTFFGDLPYHQLAETTIAKAQGSFLWVKLACDELQRNWRRCQSFETLNLCLNTLPTELNQLYSRIFDQLDANEKEDLARMLTILVNYQEQLTVPEFCQVFDFSRSKSEYSSLDLLPSRLEPLLKSLAEQGRFPNTCQCEGSDYHCLDMATDEKTINTSAASITIESSMHGKLKPDSNYFDLFPSTESARNDNLAPENRGSSDRGTARSTLISTSSCPHTGANVYPSDKSTFDEWQRRVIVRINMISRGLVQADTSSVSLSHETVARFWDREIAIIWQKPKWFGHHVIIQACMNYLELFAKYNVLPKDVGLEDQRRLFSHYGLLRYSLLKLRYHCKQSEQISQCQQSDILGRLTPGTLRYWQAVFPYWRNRGNVPLNVHERPDLCNLELALELRLVLTAKHLFSKMALDTPSRLVGVNVRDYMLFLAAGSDDSTIVDELIRTGTRLNAESMYTVNAFHRAIAQGNQQCLEALLKACASDEALLGQTSSSCFTSSIEVLPNLDHSTLDHIDEGGAYSLLETAIMVGNDAAFDVILSYARQIPLVTGSIDLALIAAVYHNRTWAITALQKAGADPNVVATRRCQASQDLRSKHSCCALAAAFQSELRVQICQELLRSGADPMIAMEPRIEGESGEGRIRSCNALGHYYDDERARASTPFLAAVAQFAQQPTFDILHIICWLFQHGAEYETCWKFSQLMTDAQWQFVQNAADHLYIPRYLIPEPAAIELVWLEEGDPLMVDATTILTENL